jgi:hypothetical protein
MSFSVGDIVLNCGSFYVIHEVSSIGKVKIKPENSDNLYDTWYRASLFNLVTPAGPPTPVLTGMTQFFKGIKEKTNGLR